MNLINNEALKNHSSVDSILREYFDDYYVGTCVDWNDPGNEDYLFTKDILFDNDVYGLVVDDVVVAIAELYTQGDSQYLNIFTKQSERRKGYSYALAKQLMEMQLVNSWSVSTVNIESIHLALKLGMVERSVEDSYEKGFRYFVKEEVSHGSRIYH